MADSKKKKKQRRIKGKVYWESQGMMNELKEMQKALGKWQEEKAEELVLYPDQINWTVGSIFDPLVEIKGESVINAKVIGRISQELFKEYKNKMLEIEAQDDKLVALQKKLAKQLDIWPDMINLRNGVISDKEYEEVEIEEEDTQEEDPDTPKKKKKEPEKEK